MGVILVFGTSGCAKGQFLKSLEGKNSNIWTTELEKEWEEVNRPKVWHMLFDKPEDMRRKALEEAIELVKKKIPRRKIALIGIHATNLIDEFLSSPVPIKALQDLRVKFCITLLDDLASVQYRLAQNNCRYNFDQLLLWRSTELLVADLVSIQVVRNKTGLPNPPNFLLGVKHPFSSTIKLLSNPRIPKVYSAYSITGILKNVQNRNLYQQLINETAEYRKNLYNENIIVFDPQTFDDRILINKVLEDKKPKNINIRVTITASDRWPYIIGEGNLQPIIHDPENLFPLEIEHAELFSLAKQPPGGPPGSYNKIDAQITLIDLRYARQADFITVWRPFNQGFISTGCAREARDTVESGKLVIAFSPLEDRNMLKKNPDASSRPLKDIWPRSVRPFDTKEKFWRSVKRHINELGSVSS